MLERNKLVNEATLIQTESDKITFPRNEWVHLELSVLMKRNRKGTRKIWQNNLLIIDESGIRTMPKDKAVFLQGTKGIYNSIQIGVTANSDNNDASLLVDDVFCEEQ